MHIRQGTTKPLVRPDQTNKVKGNNKKGGKERMKGDWSGGFLLNRYRLLLLFKSFVFCVHLRASLECVLLFVTAIDIERCLAIDFYFFLLDTLIDFTLIDALFFFGLCSLVFG
jgi:hypothetical protein